MTKEKTWTTKAGQKVRICDMSDQHLINTILMLRRNGETRLSLASLLIEAISLRSEKPPLRNLVEKYG